MADKIQVVRILRYTYDSLDEYEQDRSNWTELLHIKGRRRMVSVTLPPEAIHE